MRASRFWRSVSRSHRKEAVHRAGTRSSVSEWGRLVHPKDGHRKVFCVLHAYLDDSGTHNSSPVCVVAGYFGTEEHWEAFDREWRKTLDDNGQKEFHANRFWSHVRGSSRQHSAELKGVSEYRGWDKERCDRFVGRLLSIIESHRVFPIGCAVAMEQWKSLTQDERAVLTGAKYDSRGKLTTTGAPNKTYFLPFRYSILAAIDHCTGEERLHCSFDRNDSFSNYALEYFQTMKGLRFEGYRRLGEIFFPGSEDATPIQAADLLAYEWNQYARQRLEADWGAVNLSPILSRAIKNRKRPSADCKLFHKQGLDVVLRDFRKKRRAVT